MIESVLFWLFLYLKPYGISFGYYLLILARYGIVFRHWYCFQILLQHCFSVLGEIKYIMHLGCRFGRPVKSSIKKRKTRWGEKGSETDKKGVIIYLYSPLLHVQFRGILVSIIDILPLVMFIQPLIATVMASFSDTMTLFSSAKLYYYTLLLH